MRTKRREIRAAAAAAAVLTLAIAPAAASAQSPPQVVASSLDSPRHLTFSADGELYVAEAGRGGSVQCGVSHPALGPSCFGFSGAVTRVRDTGADERVVTGLPSIAGADEALGPSDIAFTGSQKYVLSIGLGGSDVLRAAYGSQAGLLGTLVTGKLKHDGVSLFADVLANEKAANPDGTDIDSNPVGLVRQGDGYILADAGGNAVVRASHKGTFTTITPLPPGSAPRSAVPGPATRHADPHGRRADLGGPGARRRVLHQPVDGLPVREGRCQHLARRSRPGRDGLRLRADQPHRSGVRARWIALRGRDREQRPAERSDRRAGQRSIRAAASTRRWSAAYSLPMASPSAEGRHT